MSLFLQNAIEALAEGNYKDFRLKILPFAPISIPSCMLREVEFAERCCFDNDKDRLFPIRFMWLLEANEQRHFGSCALKRSIYHPEKLMELWNRASAEAEYRQELEDKGFQFNFNEKAMLMSQGWIYIGDQFIKDFIEVEDILGVELLFSSAVDKNGIPAFRAFKKER